MLKQFQILGLVVLVALASSGVLQFAAADAEPKKARLQWEWNALNDRNARRLDPAEGWELVAVDQGVLYFKRLK